MAGGKLAWDAATSRRVDKWETLLRIAGLDPQIEKGGPPFLDEARAKAGGPRRPAGADARGPPVPPRLQPSTRRPPRRPPSPRHVAGTVSGGGPGPGRARSCG